MLTVHRDYFSPVANYTLSLGLSNSTLYKTNSHMTYSSSPAFHLNWFGTVFMQKELKDRAFY